MDIDDDFVEERDEIYDKLDNEYPSSDVSNLDKSTNEVNDIFVSMLCSCEAKDNGYILRDINTINKLIAAAYTQKDAETTYIINTLVQAKQLVEQGKAVFWNQDGIEVYESVADTILNSDEVVVHNVDTTEDKDKTQPSREDISI